MKDFVSVGNGERPGASYVCRKVRSRRGRREIGWTDRGSKILSRRWDDDNCFLIWNLYTVMQYTYSIIN